MKAKRVLALSLALALTFSVAGVMTGCGKDGKTGKDGKKVTLEVLTQRTDLDQNGTLAKVTKAFEDANNCTVKYISYTNYADDVSTRMGTNDFGDVLMIPDSVKLEELSNFFEPLDTYTNASTKWDCVDSKMYEDQVYGYPTALNIAGGIVYNKTVFENAGITKMPTTPDEFIADLKLIAEKCEGVIPLYTNFAAAWPLAQWQGLVCSASGDSSYETNILKDKSTLFEEGNAYYTVYKMMYDVLSDKTLREPDPSSTDWDGSKVALAKGQIGTLVLGSWGVAQIREEAVKNNLDPDTIGYMVMPSNVDGKQYAQISADYCMGVNKNSTQKELAKKFVEWYCADSGIATSEMAICAVKGSEKPAFMEGVNTFINEATPEEYQGVFNKIDKESEIGTWDTDVANFKIKMCEAAFANKGESEFESIIKDVNTKWEASRKEIMGE
ncbi:MAG: extracellular solute-binding protein [Clostridiales bacterium]|nr:extracellular solute-binding protein [Clostridiales bacterium]